MRPVRDISFETMAVLLPLAGRRALMARTISQAPESLAPILDARLPAELHASVYELSQRLRAARLRRDPLSAAAVLWRTARLEGPGFRQLEETARDVLLELSLSALRGSEPLTWTVLPEGDVHLAVAGRRCTLNPQQVQVLYDALGEALARDALSQWMNEPQAAEAAK